MKDNREFIFYRQFNNAGATGGEDLIDLVKHSYPHNSGWDGWNTNAVSPETGRCLLYVRWPG